MAFWEYIWSWPTITKWLYHLNWNALDSSWNWNNWTATNVTYSFSRAWSNGAYFQASPSSYIESSSNLWISWNASRTYNVWFKKITMSAGTQVICCTWVESVNNALSSLELQLTSSNVYYLYHSWWFQDTQSPVNHTCDSNWHMATMTYDWTNVKLYFDWVLEISQARSLNTTNALWKLHRRPTWLMSEDMYIDECVMEVWTAWSYEKIKKEYTKWKWRFWFL